jgi:3-oxoacyl-[acyl-carrier-protein] synthase II
LTIVVTGVGAVTALGATARETFDRLVDGERGFRELSLFEGKDLRTRIVAEVPNLLTDRTEGDGGAAHAVSRTSELALLAAREALADAGLAGRSRRVGLVLGGTTAGMFETESLLAALLSPTTDAGEREAALSRMLSHPLSAPTDRLVRELGPFARARSLSSACSSGANALLVGATWLELGLVDAVLCGGADALCRVTLNGFNALAALDPSGARPFDARRRGLTLGEGAGFFVLERREAAADKRAICTLLGWASRSEAHHITNPEASGEAPFRAIQAALARAGLSADVIDYVNAHGTGTPLNDAMEARVIARVFGDGALRVRVSSQKGMLGHTLAAAGAIEAVVTALAVQRSVVPPTGGLEEPDPALPLRHVRVAEPCTIRAALSSSFGFGGMDTALVFGRADAEVGAAAPRAAARAVVVTGVSVVTPAGVFTDAAVADLPSVTMPSGAVEVALGPDALDPDRARRLDRASRLAAVACGRALGAVDAPPAREAGVVLGIAFGAVDACAEFMGRLQDKGPRMVRPADFPSLVPSSPAGHVSIYLGLTGPAFVVADLGASGECALAQACELIRAGEAERICAGAVEERSRIVEDVLSIAFADAGERRDRGSPRREGAAAVALASADAGLPALARLGDMHVWWEPSLASAGVAARTALAALPPAPDGALVVIGDSGARAQELVLASSWAHCPRIVCADACGTHEAVGAVAIAVACAKVARGDVTAALAVGSARGSSYALTVWPPDHAP